MVDQDKILKIVQESGPLLPSDIKAKTGADSMIIGAYLSTLLKSNKIKITKNKWDGSPLYYHEGQEEQIQKLAEKMNSKDKRVFDMLKENKILDDQEQEPLTRACLRNLPDFAFPLNIKTPNGTKLYWKWYRLSNDEAIAILKSQYQKPQEPIVQQAPKEEPKSEQEVSAQKEEQMQKQEPKVEQQSEKPDKKLDQKLEQKSEPKTEFIAPKPIEERESAKIAPARETEKTIPAFEDIADDFYKKVAQKLSSKGVEIRSCTVMKKNSELDLVIKIPTPIGSALYYAKAKSKKKSTDADLAQALIKGQIERLPTAYITFGDATKKTIELLKTDYKNILFVQL